MVLAKAKVRLSASIGKAPTLMDIDQQARAYHTAPSSVDRILQRDPGLSILAGDFVVGHASTGFRSSPTAIGFGTISSILAVA